MLDPQLDLILNNNSIRCRPFLRWAGGKNWFVKFIGSHLPSHFNNYHEPFLGGGSVFFSLLTHKKNYLSDLNDDLIATYCEVRDNVGSVISALKKYENTETAYYEIRSKKYQSAPRKAAQFIFLNMTSFNGIYRVNREGVYNVPFGHRYRIDFVQEDTLRNASIKLAKCVIKKNDFEDSFKKVKKGDFVFIDPPYTVAHSNNGFILYNQKLFSLEDQFRLADGLKTLNKMKVKYLVTNAYHETIRDIYNGVGDFYEFQRSSLIGGRKAVRGSIKEYIIKNY